MTRLALCSLLALVSCKTSPEVTSVDTTNEQGGTRLVTVVVACHGKSKDECEYTGVAKISPECPNMRLQEVSANKTPEQVTLHWRCFPRP